MIAAVVAAAGVEVETEIVASAVTAFVVVDFAGLASHSFGH